MNAIGLHDMLKAHNNRSFWVCEKSDGVRVLVVILYNGLANTQDIFLVSSTSMNTTSCFAHHPLALLSSTECNNIARSPISTFRIMSIGTRLLAILYLMQNLFGISARMARYVGYKISHRQMSPTPHFAFCSEHYGYMPLTAWSTTVKISCRAACNLGSV
jgi:hypothetical protein